MSKRIGFSMNIVMPLVNVLLAGVALGVAGSAHCLAMCLPLLSAIAPRGRRAVLHHASRATVYIMLGVLAGLAGARKRFSGAIKDQLPKRTAWERLPTKIL